MSVGKTSVGKMSVGKMSRPPKRSIDNFLSLFVAGTCPFISFSISRFAIVWRMLIDFQGSVENGHDHDHEQPSDVLRLFPLLLYLAPGVIGNGNELTTDWTMDWG